MLPNHVDAGCRGHERARRHCTDTLLTNLLTFCPYAPRFVFHGRKPLFLENTGRPATSTCAGFVLQLGVEWIEETQE